MRILITGGATGLGQALAQKWAQNYQELQICIADIHNERGAATIKMLQALGADAFYFHCDITNTDNVNELVHEIKTRWDGIDLVFNNAGVATGGGLLDESIEQWEWVYNINMLGMVRVSQAFMPLMRAQKKGHFINIASQAGLTPIPYMGSYNAVKAAVVSFSETMKLELAPDGIDVSVVCPSFFKTNLDESLRSSNPAAHKMIDRFFAKADVTREDVAEAIYQQVRHKRFLILTHKLGKRMYWLKKLLPSQRYIKKMLKYTAQMKQVMEKHK